MSGPLTAVRDFFVAPSGLTRPVMAPAPAPPSFAVLGERRDAVAVAASLVLARASECGLLCVWPPHEIRTRVPATAGARRLGARLEARGIAASASGRLARVLLPEAGAEAVAAAQRAVSAAGAAAAIALTGPRDPDLDTVLTLQDAIVLVIAPEADPALVRLAQDGLAGLAPPVVSVAPPSGLARELAASGVWAPRSLRARVQPALEAAR